MKFFIFSDFFLIFVAHAKLDKSETGVEKYENNFDAIFQHLKNEIDFVSSKSSLC